MAQVITRTSGDERRRQRNAREASAQANRDLHAKPKTEIDWDAAIARTKKMVDDIERKHSR